MTHPFAFDVNQQTISGPKVYTAVCASRAGISVAIVCCTPRVDSRIPQDSPGCSRTSHDSLVWSARDEGATYVRAHPTLQVMGRAGDVGKPNKHEPGSLGRTRGLPKQSSNKRSVGDTPLSEVSKASVLHMGRHPPSGGFPLGDSLSYAGSDGVLLDGGGGSR